ncbi:MAG: hypothetical protein ACPGVO_05290 [Spirulinaceae cyanobacterium]
MPLYLQPLPGAVPQIRQSAAQTGVLTLSDRYGLLAATLDETLESRDRSALDMLLRAVRRGEVRLETA